MAKKIILSILLAVLFILGLSTICFAESENTTTTLGNEVSSSMNKTERSMDDLGEKTGMDKVGRTVENGARSVGNAVAGTTREFTSGQYASNPDTNTGRNGISQNAWIWIVMIVVALIIVASVWFYAASQRD